MTINLFISKSKTILNFKQNLILISNLRRCCYSTNCRFHGMIASINNAIKTHKFTTTFPANKFCYRVLNKLRDYGLLTGFHFTHKFHQSPYNKKFIKVHFSNKKLQLYKGYPVIRVYLNEIPGYISLKTYPLTGSHFITVSSKDIRSNIKTSLNKHTRRRHVLLTTREGLRWDYELSPNKHLGGKLLLTCIKRFFSLPKFLYEKLIITAGFLRKNNSIRIENNFIHKIVHEVNEISKLSNNNNSMRVLDFDIDITAKNDITFTHNISHNPNNIPNNILIHKHNKNLCINSNKLMKISSTLTSQKDLLKQKYASPHPAILKPSEDNTLSLYGNQRWYQMMGHITHAPVSNLLVEPILLKIVISQKYITLYFAAPQNIKNSIVKDNTVGTFISLKDLELEPYKEPEFGNFVLYKKRINFIENASLIEKNLLSPEDNSSIYFSDPLETKGIMFLSNNDPAFSHEIINFETFEKDDT